MRRYVFNFSKTISLSEINKYQSQWKAQSLEIQLKCLPDTERHSSTLVQSKNKRLNANLQIGQFLVFLASSLSCFSCFPHNFCVSFFCDLPRTHFGKHSLYMALRSVKTNLLRKVRSSPYYMYTLKRPPDTSVYITAICISLQHMAH
jgi:hypothetical protein